MKSSLIFFFAILLGSLFAGCWGDRPSLESITNGNHAPNVPTSPNPPDHTQGVPRFVTLSWICTDPENDSLTYDVYLDVVNPPVTVVIQGISGSSYETGLLPSATIVYWKIKAKDTEGNDTDGPVWSFTTSQ